MLTWILIIFVLALIFGVIKVETLKGLWKKIVDFVKEGLDKNDSSEDKQNKKSK